MIIKLGSCHIVQKSTLGDSCTLAYIQCSLPSKQCRFLLIFSITPLQVLPVVSLLAQIVTCVRSYSLPNFFCLPELVLLGSQRLFFLLGPYGPWRHLALIPCWILAHGPNVSMDWIWYQVWGCLVVQKVQTLWIDAPQLKSSLPLRQCGTSYILPFLLFFTV